MVAIVTGNGLGLERSSGFVLGSKGQVGSAAFGRFGENVTVNAATGNLVIGRTDEILIGQGPDSLISRSYNSLSGTSGLGTNDSWSLNDQRHVQGLTGTINSTGSTITLIDWDGSNVTYDYDATRGSYVSKEGSGAYDTLSYSAGSDQWTWTDGSTQVTDTFDNANNGRLISSADANGNTLTYSYTGSQLTRVTVTDASGATTEHTDLTWSGGNLTQITTTLSDGSTVTRTRYTYDAQNRLSTVITDLTPNDNSITDGNTVVTTYTYLNSTSNLIASISQTGGATLNIGYDASNRVQSISQVLASGVTDTTTFGYAAGSTTITDQAGQVTTMTYDGADQLTGITLPAAQSGATQEALAFTYDGDGNVLTATDGNGNVTSYSYDSNGNTTLIRDQAGNTVARTYDSSNRLLTQTNYTVPDPDGSGAGQPGGAETTRYVYDGNGNLRFVVSPLGEVVEYQYNGAGEQTASIAYRGSSYSVSGLGVSASIALSAMTGWTAGISDKSDVQRTDTTYDFRGNVSTVTSYSQADSSGAGLTSATYTTVTYTYDQYGNLLTRHTSGVANSEAFVYDGLGRVIGSTDLNGASTSIVFTDSQNKTVATLANGLVQTSVYNLAGELISYAQSGSGITTATASYSYDALGQLRQITDANGNSTYYLYDNDGRKVADITADGSVTEYRYDLANRLVSTTGYATKLSAAQISSLVSGGAPANVLLSSIRPGANAADVWRWNIYDTANRLVETIDGDGDVVTFAFDGASNLVATKTYANLLTATQVSGFKTTAPTASTLPSDAPSTDTLTRNFYDADNRLIGTLNADGYLTQIVYDEAGEKTATVAYANATLATHRENGSFATLLGDVGSSASDRYTRYCYDGEGKLTYTLDNSLRPVQYVYDSAGNLLHTIDYAGSIAATSTYTAGYISSQISSLGLASNASTRTAWNIYDDAGRLAYSIDANGGVVAYSYDAVGELVKTTAYSALNPVSSDPTLAAMASWASSHASDASNRVTRSFYNPLGQVVYTVDGEGYVTENQYDLDGHVSKTIRYPSSIAVSDSTTTAGLASLLGSVPANAVTTIFTYDHEGRVQDITDGNGVVTHTDYDALGRVTDVTVASGLPDAATTHYNYDAAGRVSSRIDAAGTAEASTTLYTYDGHGQVTSKTDGRGNTTTYTYDNLGRILTQTTPIDGSTSATITNVYDAFGNVIQSTDANGNSSFYYYDGLNRLTYQVDAEGYVTQTVYGFGNEITSVIHYATATSGASAGVLPAISSNSAHDEVTTFTRDNLGRVTKVTDAEGYYEQYTLNAFGDQVTVRNKLGGITNNVFDHRGLLTSATMIENAYTTAGAVEDSSIVTTYTYDARGNLTQKVEASNLSERRTTLYSYDKMNRLLQTVAGDGITLTANDLTTSVHYPTTTNVYDDRGDLVETSDPTGAKTFNYYDHLGRKIASVNAAGTLSTFTYDGNGNVVSQRVYGDAIALPGSPGGAAPAPVNGANYRETDYTYDKANRLLTTAVVGVAYAVYTGSTLASGTTNLVVTNTYDKDGNITSQQDADGRTVYYYYDRRGDKVAQVDQDLYLTLYTRDANGNVTSQTSVATPLPSAPSTSTTIASLAASASLGGNDRVTTFTYDRNGNRLTETRQNVTSYTVNGSGILSATTGSASVIYTYNGLGEVTSKTEATGDATNYAYDAFGRQTSIATASINGVTPTTTMYYDGLGDLTRAVVNSNLVTTNTYGAGGLLLSSTDASGFTTYYGYDADGRVVSQSYTRTLSDGTTTVTEAKVTRYDAMGRSVYQGVATWNGSSWVFGDYTQTQYDAYGEVTATGENGVWQVSTSYDNAGRAWKTTAGDGVIKIYGYDQNGNQTVEVTSDGNALPSGYSWSSMTQSQAISLGVSGTPGMVVTFKMYNGRGLNTAVVQPGRQIDGTGTAYTITKQQSYDAFGDVISETDARGNVTNYTYNTIGKLVQTLNPNVSVTDESGNSTSTRPLQTNYYDQSGRLVAVQDANGNITSQWLLAGTGYNGSAASVTKQFNPDGGTVTYGYDAYGNQISVTDANNNVTQMVYDAMGRLVQVTHATRAAGTAGNATGAAQTLVDHYTYDGLGQRVAHWNSQYGSSSQDRTDYDADGRVVRTVDMAGHTTNTSYNWSSSINTALAAGGSLGTFGGWVETTSKADSPSASAFVSSTTTVDYFNRTVSKSDFGGNSSSFSYNQAGQLTNQVVSGNENIQYLYYNTGALKQIDDYTYSYDPGTAQTSTSVGSSTTTQVSTHYGVTADYIGTALGYETDSAGNTVATGYYNAEYATHYDIEYQTVGTTDTYTTQVSTAKTVDRRTSLSYDLDGNRTHEAETLITTNNYGTYYNDHNVSGPTYHFYSDDVGSGYHLTEVDEPYSYDVADYTSYTYYYDQWVETAQSYEVTDSCYGATTTIWYWPETGYHTVQDPTTYYTYYTNQWVSDAYDYSYTDGNGNVVNVYDWPAVGSYQAQDPTTYYTYYTTQWVSDAYDYTYYDSCYGAAINVYAWPSVGSYQVQNPTTYHTAYYWVEDGSQYYDSCYGGTYFYDYGYGHYVAYQAPDSVTYSTVYYNYTSYGYSDPGNYGHYTSVPVTVANAPTYHTVYYNYTAYGYSDPGTYGHYADVPTTVANAPTYTTTPYTYYETSTTEPPIGYYQTVQATGYTLTGYHTVSGTYTYYTNDAYSFDTPSSTYDDSGAVATDYHTYVESGPITTSVVLEDESITYDAMNRVTSIHDDGYYAGSSPVAPTTIDIKYDANGNVRERYATYRALDANGNPASSDTVQDYWYKYDSMNRVVTAMGTLSGGVISRGTTGFDITYDAAGNRKTQTDTTTSGDVHQEIYTYTADGILAEVDYSLNGATAVKEADYALDQMGRTTVYKEYGPVGSNPNGVVYERDATYDIIGEVTADTVTRQMGMTTIATVPVPAWYTATGTYTYTDSSGHWLGGVLVHSHTDQSSTNADIYEPSTDTTNSYVWRDSAVLSSTAYEADAVRTVEIPGYWDPSGFNCWVPGYTTQVGTDTTWVSNYKYDGEGNLIEADINDGQPRTVTFINNQMGEVLKRDVTYSNGSTAGNHERHYYLEGTAIGDVTNDGTSKTDYAQSIAILRANNSGSGFNPTVGYNTPNGYGPFADGANTASPYADFDQSYNPINGFDAGTTASNYSVHTGDTLTSIALALWGDANLWYLIAQANGIDASTQLQPGQNLIIPNNLVHNFHNNASTVSVYNPGKAIGNIAPNAPEIPAPPPPPVQASHGGGGGCGIFGQIIQAVISVAVTIFAGPVAGDAAGQLFGLAIGQQKSFNFGELGIAALTAGVTQGLNDSGVFSGLSDSIGSTGAAIVEGAVGSTVTQGIAVATGLQKSFNWTGVAAAGIGLGAANFVSGQIGGSLGIDFNRAASGTANAIAQAATISLLRGTDFGDSLISALPNVVGTIGNAYADQIGGWIGGAVEGPAGVPMQTVQPKNIQVPDLDLSDLSVPYFNDDGSISSMPYATTGGSSQDSYGTASRIGTVEVTESNVGWIGSSDGTIDRGSHPYPVPAEDMSDATSWQLEMRKAAYEDAVRKSGETYTDNDLNEKTFDDLIAQAQAREAPGVAAAEANEMDMTRLTLAPVDFAVGGYNIATGNGHLRDYLSVGGAVAGPILGKLVGVAAPFVSRLGRVGEIAAESEAAPLLRTEVRNGYTYTLDDLNRTTSIEGDLVSNPNQGRNALAQLQAGGADRLATDEGGHFIGRRFDGPLDDFNHFAQDMNLNRGAYKSLENSWQRALDNGSSVNVNITPNYTGSSLRPSSLDVNYTIDGVPYQKSFLNRPGG